MFFSSISFVLVPVGGVGVGGVDALVVGEHEILVFQHDVHRVGAVGGDDVEDGPAGAVRRGEAAEVLGKLDEGPVQGLPRHPPEARLIAPGRGVGEVGGGVDTHRNEDEKHHRQRGDPPQVNGESHRFSTCALYAWL